MTRSIPAEPWWSQCASLTRVVSDLLSAELALMRPGLARRPLPWPPELDLAADLGADSLELLGLASAMEELLGIGGVGGIGEQRLLADTQLAAWVDAAAMGLAGRSDAASDVVKFRTSGSSGAPKTCVHALTELWQETAELARLFAGTRRIVSCVASHHIYGFLFTVLLPHALGLDPEAVIDARSDAPGAMARSLQPGDLVIGYPDFWRAFASAADALAGGVQGVSSTAPCPDEVTQAVTATGLARLVQVYGSSETAGVGWRESAQEDYRLFPYWRADQDPAILVRCRADGLEAAYPLQDKLAWSAPGRFRPAGRIDQAVQVGGVNVFPGYVADVLRMHPLVADAAVRLMRPDEGARLKAFVQPRAGVPADCAALRTDLHAWMAGRLAAPECPAAYSFGEALPRQASGKPADWIIDAWP